VHLTPDEHREILAALIARNPQRVEELLVKHNRVSIERLLPGMAGVEGAAGAAPLRAEAGRDDKAR
jgi:DNA-binding GntR family transcriptional regulator